ncbi:MAG: twin-arginine translocase TatA/TatE family subunit [Planctomycetota bacterium]|jgi:sec-independent protein translocase protein TatA|nr:twin-arginine translocase TatA/TatE family subunit [Planctomycetota bacterium]
MFGLSTWEILIFAGIIVLLFGGARLPGLMRNMGRSINEFKTGIKEQPAEMPPVEDKTGESEYGE